MDMTIEQCKLIDAAELSLQKIWNEGTGADNKTLIQAFEELQKCYAMCGVISNKVTIVNSVLGSLRLLETAIFKSSDERNAIIANREAEIQHQKDEELKQRLFDEFKAEEASRTVASAKPPTKKK